MKKLIFLLVALSSFSLIAQSNFPLDTIQVTAVQVPMKIEETGRNITVVTAAQIRATPATSIDEVLQTVAGLEVQSRGGFGVQGDILLRGSTFTQVLILLDGMKVNDPLTGHFNSYLPVTLAEIERIEILRGAAAAMYGADAVGGVINIITHTFSNRPLEGTQLNGALNYGEHKLVSGYQGFSVAKGRMRIGGGFSMNQSEGEYFAEQRIDSSTTLTDYNNYFDLKTAGLSFAYDLGKGYRFRARSAYDYRDFGARYFYTSSPFDKSTETVANWWNQVQLVKQSANSSTDLNLAYKYNTDEFVFSPDFPSTNVHTSELLNLTVNHLREISERVMFRSGVQVDQRMIESNDRGNHEDLHFGAYLTGVYRHGSWNLTASLRGDYDENYAFELSPQLNVAYVLPRLTFRASLGKSVRAADYTERYVSNNLENLTPGRSLGNPDLMAERAWSEELGINYQLAPGWQVKATAFARQSNNLIDYVSTNESEIGSVSTTGSLQEGADYFFARNVTDVSTTGVEFESVLRQKLAEAVTLQWNLGYTVLNTSNEADVVSVYISNHAKQLLTNRLLLNWKAVDLALTGLYKQRNGRIASGINAELEDSYALWNVRLGVGLGAGFGLNVQIHNLFDRRYQNLLGAQMPGRWFMAGFKWSL